MSFSSKQKILDDISAKVEVMGTLVDPPGEKPMANGSQRWTVKGCLVKSNDDRSLNKEIVIQFIETSSGVCHYERNPQTFVERVQSALDVRDDILVGKATSSETEMRVCDVLVWKSDGVGGAVKSSEIAYLVDDEITFSQVD